MPRSINSIQIPIAKAVLLFALGIIGGKYCIDLAQSHFLYSFLTIVAFSIVIYYLSDYKVKSYLIFVYIFLCGVAVFNLKVMSDAHLILPQEYAESGISKSIEVTEIRKYKKSNAIIGSLVSINQNDLNGAGVILFAKKDDPKVQDISKGNLITFDKQIDLIEENAQGEFAGYNSYLRDQGILYRSFIRVDEYETIENYNYAAWKKIRYKWRDAALSYVDHFLEGEANAITKALLLGDKSSIAASTKAMYAQSGIIHVLAVSGLHVGFVVVILIWIFDRLFFWMRPFAWTKVILTGMALIVFIELSGGAAPVSRAVIMSILFLIAKAWHKRFSTINLLAIAALIILGFNPKALFGISFQLSFAAVGGILLFVPHIMPIFKFEHWLPKWIWGIIAVGIAAQVSTLPITFFYFNQVPLWSPIAGVIAIPLTGAALGCGMAMILLGALWEPIGQVLAMVQELFIAGLSGVAEVFSKLPISVWGDVHLLGVESLLLLAALVMIAYYINTYRQKALIFASLLLLLQAIVHTGIIIHQSPISGTAIHDTNEINQEGIFFDTEIKTTDE